MSNSCCSRLVQFQVSYCFNLLEGKDMSSGRHGTMIDSPYVWCIATREQFCSMNSGDILNMAGTMIDSEEYAMVMDNVNRMKAAVYGQLRRKNVK